MCTWGYWLDMIIPRIGTSALLDRAVMCLIAAHKTRLSPELDIRVTGRYQYAEALSLLRHNVNKDDAIVTADMIAATKMLMAYE